ncbi:Glutamate decarboxylase 1 [Zea mays]|uniref:Glutamate decarboxylase 1 n=1 Tax=Zea mays TaxID=4577 RepID=A0A1D6L2J4_MAIZE|nr:Glutamate decarboxylase 1 [Zea mays]
MENCQENATVLKQGLEKTGKFNIVSKDNGVPLVAFSLKDSSRHSEFEKVLHELDALPARVPSGDLAALAAAESSEREMEKQRQVISLWKRAVLAKKKTNGVC